jgi:hypothetical protein
MQIFRQHVASAHQNPAITAVPFLTMLFRFNNRLHNLIRMFAPPSPKSPANAPTAFIGDFFQIIRKALTISKTVQLFKNTMETSAPPVISILKSQPAAYPQVLRHYLHRNALLNWPCVHRVIQSCRNIDNSCRLINLC